METGRYAEDGWIRAERQKRTHEAGTKGSKASVSRESTVGTSGGEKSTADTSGGKHSMMGPSGGGCSMVDPSGGEQGTAATLGSEPSTAGTSSREQNTTTRILAHVAPGEPQGARGRHPSLARVMRLPARKQLLGDRPELQAPRVEDPIHFLQGYWANTAACRTSEHSWV